MNLMVAPVQGHTDAAWRHFHNNIYGGNPVYYTPFIRLEHGAFRKHDIKDLTSELNDGLNVVPQVIFRNMDELRPLLAGLAELSVNRVDLNTGCPFPLQTAKGRGAGFIANSEEFSKMPQLLSEFPGIDFSLKMRLGFSNPDEWRSVMPILNDIKLTHVTLHPRIAKQQYGGEVDLEQFGEFVKQSENPVIYNGDLRTMEDIKEIQQRFPEIAGVMLGRGLLARPSLIAEYSSGEEWNPGKRLDLMRKFHSQLLDYYQSTLCGDSQVLSKIKPFWEYAEQEIGRKPWKAIKKATTLAKYHTAVASV